MGGCGQGLLDTVSYNWLIRTLELHKIPNTIINTIVKLSHQWKTSLRVKTQVGVRLTERIQGDTLCPLLFTMRVNPMARKLRILQGYRMTKPVNTLISHSFLNTRHANSFRRLLCGTNIRQFSPFLSWSEIV